MRAPESMSKKTLPGWIGGLAGSVIAGFATGIGYWPAPLTWLEKHEALAAWVQAVGSVAAIWAGFHVANRAYLRTQHEARLTQHREELRRYGDLIRAAYISTNRLSATIQALQTTEDLLGKSEIIFLQRTIAADLKIFDRLRYDVSSGEAVATISMIQSLLEAAKDELTGPAEALNVMEPKMRWQTDVLRRPIARISALKSRSQELSDRLREEIHSAIAFSELHDS